MFSELAEKGVRLTVDAEALMLANKPDELTPKIVELGKPLVSREDIERLLAPPVAPSVEVIRPAEFRPVAREYGSNISVVHSLDVTGKSRTKGEVANFVAHFKNRYERLARMLRRGNNVPVMDLAEAKRHVNEKVRVVVLISNRKDTKKGNLLLEVEDLSAAFKVIVSDSRYNDKLRDRARFVLLDDVVAITGKVLESFIIAEDIEWPDLPVIREKKQTEADVAVAYLSDLHFGSRYFLTKYLQAFGDWLHGKGEAKELAGKVKYISIAGDIVDGIGIYPNQEKELVVKDVYDQYRMFSDFLETIPDHIDVIVAPGNHDAVRRGEPQPALGSDLFSGDVIRVGSPSTVLIEGFRHLIYHGTSIDSMIASVPGTSYMHPEKVMVEYLKRRHLSPTYGANLIIPENIDYMVIEEPPDVFHCGHVHRNGYFPYRGTLAINSGTFQDRTDFQVKQGHVPTPALVPVLELKYNRLHTLDFKS